MQKRWTIKLPGNPETVTQLADELNINSILASLLVQRGISTFEKARHFFRPQIEDLHDPFLMKDMDKAVKRIENALEEGEKILIYGDYDVDGTTSVSLVFSFFSETYNGIDYYIPDRYTEGYGISYQGIDYAKKNNFKLIIALDCGIKAVEKVQYAKEKGIDFIICDHHRPGNEIPPAVAVLDPKRDDCSYPYDELSGCGIGFKLVQAYSIKNNISFEKLEQLLDLTAISIACDIVPITGENRVLAFYGIQQINKTPRKGIAALLETAQLKKELTVTDLVFVIGPRINAAGRIEHATKAVKLLISESDEIAETTGKSINDNNLLRREIDSSITEHALAIIAKDDALLSAKTTVLYNEEWHKGVIGIVASRLIETHYRPTIMLTRSNGMATGSARSVRGFDVYNAIDSCSDLLEQFGGHKYAAGLTMKIENIQAFQKRFEEVVSSSIDEQLLIPEITIDYELDFAEITPKFYRIMKQFAPFGPQNMKPVFVTKNLVDKGYSKAVGQEGAHLKLDIAQQKNPSKRISGIAFNFGHLIEKVKSGTPFDVVYSLDENEWKGEVSLQLKVKDMRESVPA
ncbi:MAG: single-stranded-DNA-specific exonuclease RecJ [Flavobacteriales bacterium]|nr:MAG: single-stranded-DNA-specific exonuclease RecJ [Flavobacteriales bacterium]